jgi:hypothetical protein
VLACTRISITSAATDYVYYVGVSKVLLTETTKRSGEFGVFDDAQLWVCGLYIANSKVAKDYELDLIRYYCPPQNVR